jgi:hypothetical protein
MRRSVTAALGAMLAIGGVNAASVPASAATAHRAHPLVNPATGLPVGVMPVHHASPQGTQRARPAVTSAHLTYGGGPVLSDAAVATVLYGTGTYVGQVDGSVTPGVTDFFGAIMHSPHTSWLTEYNTVSQTIGYGTNLGRTTISPTVAHNGSTIDDTSIQAELIAKVGAGTLPPPTIGRDGVTDTVYAVYFPAGKTITVNGSQSGQVFCAYHSATASTVNGQRLYYLVLPDDQNANYRQGCAPSGVGSPSDFQILESYSSHELVEAITDPYNGTGWYDSSQGEIGDICNGQGGTVTSTTSDPTSYTVQKEWSNASNACIVSKPAVAPPAPSGLSATAKPGGQVQLTWTPPYNDGGSALTGYDVYRSATLGALGNQVTTAPVGTSYTDNTPADGTYYYTVEARNSVGPSGQSLQSNGAATDSTPPAVSITAPSSLFSLSTALTTKYAATDGGSGVGSYDVRYRSAKWNGGFGAYTAPAAWQHTSLKQQTLTGAAGNEYCFSVRARDVIGNVSDWSGERCVVVPLDDRALGAGSKAWSRKSSPAAYLGTTTVTSTKDAKLTLSGAKVRQIALVVGTCSSCGKIAVYLNGTLWRTIDTHSGSTKSKVVLVVPPFALKSATIVLKDVSASSKHLVIDGIGVSRT